MGVAYDEIRDDHVLGLAGKRLDGNKDLELDNKRPDGSKGPENDSSRNIRAVRVKHPGHGAGVVLTVAGEGLSRDNSSGPYRTDHG